MKLVHNDGFKIWPQNHAFLIQKSSISPIFVCQKLDDGRGWASIRAWASIWMNTVSPPLYSTEYAISVVYVTTRSRTKMLWSGRCKRMSFNSADDLKTSQYKCILHLSLLYCICSYLDTPILLDTPFSIIGSWHTSLSITTRNWAFLLHKSQHLIMKLTAWYFLPAK